MDLRVDTQVRQRRPFKSAAFAVKAAVYGKRRAAAPALN